MSGVSVLKIGGSVLTGPRAYGRAAEFVGAWLTAHPGERAIVVVSAENGVTDALLANARDIVDQPDAETLDLLWATGELRSAALLALSLQALGVRARAVNVHQTGLAIAGRAPEASPALRPLRLLGALTECDAIVAPGFLARGCGDSIVSLGRGGSDLSAVLLAAGVDATRCELIKDVPGYFSADPKRDPSATPLQSITYDAALAMAEGGCELVQKNALEAARAARVPLIIRSLGDSAHTRVA
jgi:aspartate kinase